MLLQYILTINVAQFLPILVGLLMRGENEYAYVVLTNSELGICLSIFKRIILKSPLMYTNSFHFYVLTVFFNIHSECINFCVWWSINNSHNNIIFTAGYTCFRYLNKKRLNKLI